MSLPPSASEAIACARIRRCGDSGTGLRTGQKIGAGLAGQAGVAGPRATGHPTPQARHQLMAGRRDRAQGGRRGRQPLRRQHAALALRRPPPPSRGARAAPPHERRRRKVRCLARFIALCCRDSRAFTTAPLPLVWRRDTEDFSAASPPAHCQPARRPAAGLRRQRSYTTAAGPVPQAAPEPDPGQLRRRDDVRRSPASATSPSGVMG